MKKYTVYHSSGYILEEEIEYPNLLQPKYCCGENSPFLRIIGSITLNFNTCLFGKGLFGYNLNLPPVKFSL